MEKKTKVEVPISEEMLEKAESKGLKYKNVGSRQRTALQNQKVNSSFL